MKRTFILLLSIIFTLSIATACGNLEQQPNIDLTQTAKVDVLHYVSGQEEKWTIDDKADINHLLEWFSNLSLELKQFNEGNSPGDSDGGEVYMFASENDEFSYVRNGPNDCYILYNAQWYQVEIPTDPFDR